MLTREAHGLKLACQTQNPMLACFALFCITFCDVKGCDAPNASNIGGLGHVLERRANSRLR